YVPPPHINKTSGEHVTAGQTLVLTCTITVDWSIQSHNDDVDVDDDIYVVDDVDVYDDIDVVDDVDVDDDIYVVDDVDVDDDIYVKHDYFSKHSIKLFKGDHHCEKKSKSPESKEKLFLINCVEDKFSCFQVGFLISPVLLEHTGIYTCQARFEGKTSEYKTQLIVRPKTSYVPPPHINKTSGEHVTAGQTLVLTCTITVDWSIQVRLSWSVPNTSKNVARIETPDPISRNVTLGGKPFKVVEQRLRISNAEQEDQGSYECVVTDHSGNSKSKREFIRIYERDQSFLNVWQEGSSTIQKPGGREETVQWVVNIQAHPPPRLTWFDPDGQIIQEGEDKEKGRILQTFPTAKDTRSMLKLKGLELESSGVYRVRVENEFEVKWENFTLIVTEPPQVSITVVSQPESGLFNLGEMYTLRCTARGYPRPRVSKEYILGVLQGVS
ncbi:vascular endothelial growth factor receptor 1, partial [Eurytemora carolleeae]|uniref:vascular endothelial growth factor receptor 1 n=1 Tax=Eurytemora carolleeae TaxID=1294199 RepID=UPI000C7955AB